MSPNRKRVVIGALIFTVGFLLVIVVIVFMNGTLERAENLSQNRGATVGMKADATGAQPSHNTDQERIARPQKGKHAVKGVRRLSGLNLPEWRKRFQDAGFEITGYYPDVGIPSFEAKRDHAEVALAMYEQKHLKYIWVRVPLKEPKNLKKGYREPIKALNVLVPGIAHYFQGWSPKIQDPALKLPDVPYAIERQSGNAVKLVHVREKESVRSPRK